MAQKKHDQRKPGGHSEAAQPAPEETTVAAAPSGGAEAPEGEGRPVHDADVLSDDYRQVLAEFVRAQSEKSLYDASQLSKIFIEHGIGPEEIVALHTELIDELSRKLPLIERPRAMTVSLQFLLEVMITYGISYKEYLDLKLAEATRAIERQLEIDRIRAREEIQRQQDVMRAKEEFLEFVTHELRNPLATLMASIEYMLGGLGREDIQRRERILVRMRESMNQLIRMVNDLLAVSRAEEGERPLKLEPVVLDALVHAVVNRAAAEAERRGVELTAHLAGGDARVMGDQEWLEQALGNVLESAVDHTQSGGKVWANTGARRREVSIEVGDSGPGIPPEELPRIFDKFYQVKQSEGTGLGLYFAKRVIERHGGSISAVGEPGKGTRFVIHLPRR